MTLENCSAKEVWLRPDGTDSEVYTALAAEGRHRLAWEWLIRSNAFQEDCRAVETGSAEPCDVASTWGLYRFKHFSEPYSSNRKPRFLVSRVRPFHAKKGQVVRHIALRRGEMACVFDVDRMVRSIDSRAAQIATLVRLLDEAIVRRRLREGVIPTVKSRVNDAHLDACLQLEDLRHRGCESREIKKRVAYLRKTSDSNTPSSRFRDMKLRIERLLDSDEQGYLKLASRAHSPQKERGGAQ